MDFITPKFLLVVLHVIGVVVGGGAAFVADSIFFSSVKDAVISKTELRFIKLAGKIVWVGLAIMLISGIGIFLTNPDLYLNSSKFLAKMSIVGVLILNGILFHVNHIPRLHRHANEHLPSSDDFIRHRPHLLISGAISATSWTFAFILGSIPGIPVPYVAIMTFYLCSIVLACVGSFLIGHFFVPEYKSRI
jgi:ABC-type xylose transport system permease subunit